MEPRLLLLAVVLATTTVSSRADLQSDATEYGNKLARDLFSNGERNQEAIYTREVTGANMYGYHSQGDIDSFVAVASHVAHVRGLQLDQGYPLIEKAQQAASAAGINTGIGEFQEFVHAFYVGSMTGQEVYDATMKLVAEKTTVQAPPPRTNRYSFCRNRRGHRSNRKR